MTKLIWKDFCYTLQSSVRTKILNVSGPPAIESFGGVVGANAGTLSQASFEGEMTMSVSSSLDLKLGGIAGFNSGAVSDVYTDNRTTIRIKEEDHVGGIVGNNSGTVTRAMALGRVLYNNGAGFASNGNPMHPLVGFPMTASATDSIFLDKSIGTFHENNTISGCTGSSPSFTATVTTTTTYLEIADSPGNANMFMIDADLGDELKNFINFSVPANDQFNYSFTGATCSTWPITIGTSYPLNYGLGQVKAAFAVPANFTGINFDLAYVDDVTPANSLNEDRLLEYFKAMMDNRAPTVTPPVWELHPGDKHPKLLQLLHN